MFKRLWAGVFFGSGSASADDPTVCGRFAEDVCDAYGASAATGVPTPEILDLLAASSPASVLDRIEAPTLLLQGQADSLFPLSEGDANARGIAAGGTPVKLVWFAGGHDGGDQEDERLDALTLAWFDRYLRDDGTAADTRFEVTGQAASLFGARTGADPQVLAADAAPGLDGGAVRAARGAAVRASAQTVVAPAGGNPAQVSSLPGSRCRGGHAAARLAARTARHPRAVGGVRDRSRSPRPSRWWARRPSTCACAPTPPT